MYTYSLTARTDGYYEYTVFRSGVPFIKQSSQPRVSGIVLMTQDVAKACAEEDVANAPA